MPLTPAERVRVVAALEAVLLPSQNQRGLLGTIFTPDEEPVLREVDAGPPGVHDYAVRVVRYCLRDRWNRKPSMLERLLAELVTRGQGDLVVWRDRVRAGIDPNVNPVNSSWFTADQPFFGRPLTRSVMQTLLDRRDKPILMIQGTEKSGKTYTGGWLNYLAEEDRWDFRIIIEKLEKGSAPTMEPDLLAGSLVAKMELPIGDMPPTTKNRYEQWLCNWIISKALQRPGPTWLVLDGFDDPDLDRGTSALIQLLAANLLTGELNKRVRLVLVDFRSKLAQVEPRQIAYDSLPKPEDIKGPELVDCLQQHFADIQKPVDAGFLNALADRLVVDAQNLRSDPEYANEPWLKLLNTVVYNLRQQDLSRRGQ